MFAFILSMMVMATQPTGILVWSNFSDNKWDLYLRTEKGEVRRLTNTPINEYYPRFSMDGKWIYYINEEGKNSSIQRMDINGAIDKKWKIDNAKFFSVVNANKIIYESIADKKSRIRWRDINTGADTEAEINAKIPNTNIHEPAATSDEKLIFARTHRFIGWGVERAPGIGKPVSSVGKGCEANVSPNNEWVLYVSYDGNGKSSIHAQDTRSGVDTIAIDMPGPVSHEYYPNFSSNGEWVVFSACPNNQHYPHRGAEYRVFIKKWGGGDQPSQIVDLPGADAYPDFYVR